MLIDSVLDSLPSSWLEILVQTGSSSRTTGRRSARRGRNPCWTGHASSRRTKVVSDSFALPFCPVQSRRVAAAVSARAAVLVVSHPIRRKS